MSNWNKWNKAKWVITGLLSAGLMLTLFQNCGEELDLSNLEQTSSAGGAPTLIATNPQVTIAANSNLILSVQASPSDLQYQWYFTPSGTSNEQALPGAVLVSYIKNNVQSTDSGAYRIVGYNGLGTAQAIINVTVTGGSGNQGPLAPINFSASPQQEQIDLTWTNPAGNIATGYVVERHLSASSNSPQNTATISSASTTSFTDSGLISNTAYYYRIFTLNNGTRSASHLANVNNAPIITRPKFANFVANANSSSSVIDLSWTLINPGQNGHSGFRIQNRVQNTSNWTDISTQQNLGVSNITSASATGLAASTNYEFQICALINGACLGFGPSYIVQTSGAGNQQAPATPQNLTAAVDGNNIVLQWSSVANVSYEVERLLPGSSTWVLLNGSVNINASSVASYTDSGLTVQGTYNYRVYAKVGALRSVNPGTLSALPTIGSTGNAPGPVRNVSAQSSSNSVTLTWSAPSSGTVTAYTVESGTDSSTSSSTVTTTGTTAQITGLNADTNYFFDIFAKNGADSSPAVPYQFRTLPIQPVITSQPAPTTLAAYANCNGPNNTMQFTSYTDPFSINGTVATFTVGATVSGSNIYYKWQKSVSGVWVDQYSGTQTFDIPLYSLITSYGSTFGSASYRVKVCASLPCNAASPGGVFSEVVSVSLSDNTCKGVYDQDPCQGSVGGRFDSCDGNQF